MRRDLGGLILPLFSTSSFSDTALFGKRGEVGQLHTLFPNLHVFFLAHKPVNLLSLNTEVTPTPWLQKMHWFALLKKVIKYRKLSSWHCWKMNVQGKWSQWDSQGNIYMCGVRRRWMSCAGRGEHLPCTCGGRLWHKPWAWADPLFFFSLEMCFICPYPISSFCPTGCFRLKEDQPHKVFWGLLSLFLPNFRFSHFSSQGSIAASTGNLLRIV